MILVIGGAYQGKLTWAVEKFHLRCLCDLAEGFVPDMQCYYHLEAWTKTHEALPELPPEAVVISREVGCGIVPMDAEVRAWRERHGQTLRTLAQQSAKVFRVFCGIGEELK